MPEGSKKVQDLVEQLEQADPAAKSRHYAEVFAQLMGYPQFVKFLQDHYIVNYYLDEDSGAIAIAVDEVVPLGTPEEKFSDAFQSAVGNSSASKTDK